MFEVVNVTEEFMLELRVCDVRDGTVLVECPGVAHQPWGEVGQVGGQFLDHVTPHFIAPDHLC